MDAEVLGIDHVYFSVLSLAASERFYDDALMHVLGFRKNPFELNGDPHVGYYNRQFGFVIRPSRQQGVGAPAPGARATTAPDQGIAGGALDRADGLVGSPGLHHLCLRVAAEPDVDRVARGLLSRGIQATLPRYFHEYAPDYYATFFHDPDGIRLEVTNFRAERRERMKHWDDPKIEVGAERIELSTNGLRVRCSTS